MVNRLRCIRFLLSSEFEVFASLENVLMALSAFGAFQLEYDFLCRLDLLVKDGLGLTTKTSLLTIISPLTLSCCTRLTRLLLPGDGVALMALAAFAECVLLLRVVHHYEEFAVSGVKTM